MVCNLGVDHLGTPMRAWDNTASFVWAADTNGMRQRRSHKTLQGAAEHQPIARGCPQRGHRKDNWHRYYDPNTGRYLTPDPMGVESDPTLYSYAAGNPLRFIDPQGLVTIVLVARSNYAGVNMSDHVAMWVENGGHSALFDPNGGYGGARRGSQEWFDDPGALAGWLEYQNSAWWLR